MYVYSYIEVIIIMIHIKFTPVTCYKKLNFYSMINIVTIITVL